MDVHVTPELAERLKTLSAETGQPPEKVLQEALADYSSAKTGTLDWSQCPVVERVAGKVSGAWVLRGTRMPVATIFENLESGANLDDILAWYDGLNRDQVRSVIDFAARSLDTSASRE